MPETILIQKDLIIAEPELPSGFSFTLASRLGVMLHQAEELYGPRDKSYSILGIEFRDGCPQVWYPGNRSHVVIQLGLESLTNLPQACFQLAHECIHLLSPTGGKHANILEEGLAEHFSQLYCGQNFKIHMRSIAELCRCLCQSKSAPGAQPDNHSHPANKTTCLPPFGSKRHLCCLSRFPPPLGGKLIGSVREDSVI